MSGVESLTWEPIGNGFLGTTVRIEPVYGDSATSAPPSMVAKLRAQDEATVEFAATLRGYEREVHFYQQVIGPDSAGSAITTPACYGTEFDPDDGSFVLLLEDLRDAEPGDHLAGCSTRVRTAACTRAGFEHPMVDTSLYAFDAATIEGRSQLLQQALPTTLNLLGRVALTCRSSRALSPARGLRGAVQLLPPGQRAHTESTATLTSRTSCSEQTTTR